MLQWMGGSRRKVTASRGSTQKRQKQYFEQRRRQQQQQVSSSEVNVCGSSGSERRSLDVLSLNTLSTVGQQCSPRCLNDINVAGTKLEINAPQQPIISLSGNHGKDPVEFASKEVNVCGSSCSKEKNNNADFDPWKNEMSVLDILEDDDLKYNFRESPMSEDHVSFSVGGLGNVGTETPSPPHRMDHHGGSLCSKISRGVEMSKNPLNDLELEVEAVLQDIDTSFSGRSSKFSSYSPCQVKKFGKGRQTKCSSVENTQFDKFDCSFGGVIHGKSAYDDTEDYKKTRHHADHPNFMVDDFLHDTQWDLPWEERPHREYLSEDCWESQRLHPNSFKKPRYFYERDTEIPIDSFNFSDTAFTAFRTPRNSINFEEVLPMDPSEKMIYKPVSILRNPNQYLTPVEDPKDSSMSSEESCSSSAVRRDIKDSVAKKSERLNRIWSLEDNVKCFPGEEPSHGHRNYVHQSKFSVGTKADTDKFDTSSLASNIPAHFIVDTKLKSKDGWFGAREKARRDLDSDSKLGDWNFRYASHECSPCTANMESNVSPLKADLSLKSKMQCVPMTSFGVDGSPAIHKPPKSISGNARQDQETEITNPLADVPEFKPRKQKIDFFAMGIVQIGEAKGCNFNSNRKNQKLPVAVQSSEFEEVINSSASAANSSYKFLMSDNKNENQHKEDPDVCAIWSKETETSTVDCEEQSLVAIKNMASPQDNVLMHQSYFVQFMCVQQQASEENANYRL